MNPAEQKRSVVIAGGTGFIGSALVQALVQRGYSVVVLTRRMRSRQEGVRYVTWAPQDPEAAAQLLVPFLDEASAVVNLAGCSIADRRWKDSYKREILASRVLSTRALVRGIELAEKRPELLVNASAIGYYGPQTGDLPLDETASPGNDFLAGVCRHWEEEARNAEKLGLRVARLRTGVVLGRGGGIVRKMLWPFKLGFGSFVGSGRQWFSWIHIEDLVGMILWIMGQPGISGALNAVAPGAVTNRDFTRSFGRALHRPAIIRTPAFLVRFGAGEASTLIIDGQRVVPRLAMGAGYRFKFPEIDGAFADIVR